MKTYKEFLDSQGEQKWQQYWEDNKTFEVTEYKSKEKFYSLIEFPYPSSAGLHVGHPRPFTAMDVVSRKKRMEGFNVLYPIGFDAFGLPTENYAIKTGRPPAEVTAENIANFTRQLKMLGYSFDWSRTVDTTDPKYFKWTQWLFLQFYKHGLAYKKNMPINWCLSCKIGLANEEVVDGKCERCGGPVEKRDKEQWMLAITKYADKLLEGLKEVDYVSQVRTQQENWIGRSEGVSVKFQIADLKLQIEVFTTRPDTLFGTTYMVLAPEHTLVEELREKIENYDEVSEYINKAKLKSDLERTELQKEKSGVELKGVKAINPANKEEIPVFVADYVLASYGTGAIMAVPAHDERDFEFAKKYDLPIEPVVLKQDDKSRSFIMGISEEDIKKFDGEIIEKTESNFFKIKIPFDKLEEYKSFIREKMEPGFWNEFSIEDGFYFIFKHKDGKIEEMELNEKTNDLIDSYGQTFNDEEIKEEVENVYSWLAKNSFYKDILIHVEAGIAINSNFLNGLKTDQAKEKMIEWLEEHEVGKRKTQYKLRDWVFSRQRYWGEPIPLVHCEKCEGWVPLPEDQLPLTLPQVEKYEPTDTGESPLAAMDEWVNTTCPQCGGPAKRETDTMPNWAGSSWYFLRYMDPHNDTAFASKEALDYWAPVDWYNGGMEHTVLHLLYSRFWNQFLYDIGLVPNKEPYKKRTVHGMILAEDGEKMSKSRGNVINPDVMVEQFGTDAFRTYVMFMGPFDQSVAWDTNGVVGVRRFLERVWNYYHTHLKPSFEKIPELKEKEESSNKELNSSLHKTIKKVSEDIDSMRFNTAISQLMTFRNDLTQVYEPNQQTKDALNADIVEVSAFNENSITQKQFEIFLKLLSPFAPHITEELWKQLGHETSIAHEKWPEYDESKLVEDEVTLAVQVNGKVRGEITVAVDASEDEVKKLALEQENVVKWLEGKETKKVIYVKGRLVSVVV